LRLRAGDRKIWRRSAYVAHLEPEANESAWMSDPAPTNKRSPVFLKSGGFKLSLVDLPEEAISVRVAERPHRRSS